MWNIDNRFLFQDAKLLETQATMDKIELSFMSTGGGEQRQEPILKSKENGRIENLTLCFGFLTVLQGLASLVSLQDVYLTPDS